MKIGAISIGNELINGKVLNSNIQDLGMLVSKNGLNIKESLTLPDDMKSINSGLKSLSKKCDLVVVTGGLGPTRDDITRESIAKLLKVPLVKSKKAKQFLEEYLLMKGIEISEGQIIQTVLPRGCKPLQNKVGTACGFQFMLHKAKVLVFPGVPKEHRILIEEYVEPLLAKKGLVFLEKVIWTWGWPEAKQKEVLDSMRIPETIEFSSLPRSNGVRISLSVFSSVKAKGKKELELNNYWQELVKKIPTEKIIHKKGLPLEKTVVQYLKDLSMKVSVVESCTGGALGFLITSVSGSSSVFEKGVLTYSNEAKSEMVGVSGATLKKYGAVSREVVEEMVLGAVRRFKSHVACAISGIAGPEGGTAKKPVGTVWVAVGNQKTVETYKLYLRGGRDEIRWKAAYSTLNYLRIFLEAKIKYLHK